MRAFVNCAVYTGDRLAHDHAVLVRGSEIAGVVPRSEVPGGAEAIDLQGRFVAPGFVDRQVNGGGDVLFNEAPTVETLAKIVAAHRRFGTTDLLPTFITDSDVCARFQAASRAWSGLPSRATRRGTASSPTATTCTSVRCGSPGGRRRRAGWCA